MFRSKAKILATLVAIVIIVLFWWIFKNKTGDSSVTDVLPDITLGELAGEAKTPVEVKTTNFFSKIFGTGEGTYRDSSIGFSFNYPKDYEFKELPTSSAEEVKSLVFNKAEEAVSLQVVVSTFDEDIILTKERIISDVPDLVIKNSRAISIGSVIQGVRFESDTSLNVWFVAKGHLFQLSALPSEVEVLEKFVSSFKM